MRLALACTLLALPAFAQEKGPNVEDLVRRVRELELTAERYAPSLGPSRLRSAVIALGEIEAEIPGVNRDALREGYHHVKYEAHVHAEYKEGQAVYAGRAPLQLVSHDALDALDVYQRCERALPARSDYVAPSFWLGTTPASLAEGVSGERDSTCAAIAGAARKRGILANRGSRNAVWLKSGITLAIYDPLKRSCTTQGGRTRCIAGSAGSATNRGLSLVLEGDDSHGVRRSCMSQGTRISAMARQGSVVIAPGFADPQSLPLEGVSLDDSILCQEILRHLLVNRLLVERGDANPLGAQDLLATIARLSRSAAQVKEIPPAKLAALISRVGDIELALGQAEEGGAR
jgi:hypothetical protein